MNEGRKGTCSVCRAPSTYYGDVSQYCISDYEKLRTENAKLREALEKIVIKPLQDGDNMLLVEEYNPSKWASEALTKSTEKWGE